MKKRWCMLIVLMLFASVVLSNVYVNVEEKDNDDSTLIVENIEALEANETGMGKNPCTAAGGFCFIHGIFYGNISIEL